MPKSRNAYPVIHSADKLPRNPQVITGLGKQINIGQGRRSYQRRESGLSFPSELTATACGLLCLKALERKEEVKILFSGNGAALFPDAAEAFVKRIFPTIPASCFLKPDKNSPTTKDSVRNVPPLLREYGYSSTVMATIHSHVRRTAYQFEQGGTGVVSHMASTDLIVAASSAAAHEAVEAWHNSPLTRLNDLAEELFYYLDRGPLGVVGEAAARSSRPS